MRVPVAGPDAELTIESELHICLAETTLTTCVPAGTPLLIIAPVQLELSSSTVNGKSPVLLTVTSFVSVVLPSKVPAMSWVVVLGARSVNSNVNKPPLLRLSVTPGSLAATTGDPNTTAVRMPPRIVYR